MSRTEELIAKSQNGDEEAGEQLIQENAGLIWVGERKWTTYISWVALVF